MTSVYAVAVAVGLAALIIILIIIGNPIHDDEER